MAKFTRMAIMNCFQELLEKRSIDKITVMDICDRCEINRNTFYYYFKDIYDVLENLFRAQVEKNVENRKEDASFYDDYLAMASIIITNKESAIHVFKSKNRDIVERYIETATGELVRYHVKRVSAGRLTEEETEFVTMFFRETIIAQTNKWIEKGLPDYREVHFKTMSDIFDATLPVMIATIEKDRREGKACRE